MSQCHYMKKPGGRIEKVNLNDWARKRKAGYVFSTEAEFQDQTQATPDPVAGGDSEVPTMENTKAEIVAYLEANGYDVDENDTKAELLAAMEG